MKIERTAKLITALAVLFILSALTVLPGCNQKETSSKQVSAEAAVIAPLFEAGSISTADGTALPYRYFEPSVNADKQYPVILYLHGEEEAGTDNKAQIITTECATIWIEPDHLALNPTYVLAPQIPAGADWTLEPYYSGTLELLSTFISDHPAIDKGRIYIVGFSMGGTGAWNMILKNPGLFAFAMPISGNADKHLGDYEAWSAIKNLPVYVVHSYDDQISPVSGSLNAVAALQDAGNPYSGSSASRCIWQPSSTASPHDAWYTAFHKFEVVYNSVFEHNLKRTNHGEISPVMLYTKSDLGNGITRIWDYALSTAYVIERDDKAILVDAMMGRGDLLTYIKENVLVNKDIDLEAFITHNHNDHILGLKYFVNSPQLKKVFVHEDDAEAVAMILGKDAEKILYVSNGDLISLGGENAEVIHVPGHSLGQIILNYDGYLFPGDAIGTGYVGVGALTVEDYIPVVKHLLEKMGDNKFTILAGHTGECRKPMNNAYVHELLACAEGIVNGSLPGTPYWRNARYVATVGDASITYDLSNVHQIKGALSSLSLSQGSLDARFAAYNDFYTAVVGDNVSSIDITAKVMAVNYRSLTINGTEVKSGEPLTVSLSKGENRFSIISTSSDNISRAYTLTVKRGN